jgi:molecular chaperone GrpE
MSEEERTPPASEADAGAHATTEATAETPTPRAERAEAAGTEEADRVAALERRVAELERELDQERDSTTEYMNRWQRAQADFSNYRRRQQQDQEQMRRVFSAEAAKLVLPALDSFERAFATLPESLRGFTWIEGIALVSMQLEGSLRALGIQPILAEPGHAFDPRQHEAIGEVETSAHPHGHIADVVQRGYAVDGMVLRPTLVQVVRAPQAGAASTAGAAADPAAEAPPAPSGAESDAAPNAAPNIPPRAEGTAAEQIS